MPLSGFGFTPIARPNFPCPVDGVMPRALWGFGSMAPGAVQGKHSRRGLGDDRGEADRGFAHRLTRPQLAAAAFHILPGGVA